MDPIDRLKRLDRRRDRLNAYEARVRMAFWMPATRDRILARLNKRFREASEERSKVLGQINADPVLRKRLRDLDNAELAERTSPAPSSPKPQHQKAEAAAGPASKAKVLSRDTLENQALYVTSLKDTERHAKEAYQHAVWYYKWADWKRDNVPVEQVGGLLDRLKADLGRARKDRALAQESFEQAVRSSAPTNSHHILYREELMASVPKIEKGPVQNAFEQWLERRTAKKEPDYAEDEPSY